MKTFNCPRWPRCGCPDGTVATDCPGLGFTYDKAEAVRTTEDRIIDTFASQPISFTLMCAIAFGIGFGVLAFGIPH